MWQSLHDAWWRLATQTQPRSFSDALTCGVLHAGSVVYETAVTLRNTAYDRGWAKQVRLPCRVVSVGNLTLGGTGKTACVELIAKKFLSMGKRVAVLSRGYGGRRRSYWLRCDQDHLLVDGHPHEGADGLADEPQLLARHLTGTPILVDARRDRAGARACRQFSANVVVLDDGFQHRRLERDCDIVLVHSRMPLEGWALLPRGPMREPCASLRRAQIIMLTKAETAWDTIEALRERLQTVNREATVVLASHEPCAVYDVRTGERREPQTLAGMRLGLLSSIGDPQGFESTVQRLHATILWHQRYPDHYPYQQSAWSAVVDRATATKPDALLTTEKDWMRLAPVIGRPAVPLWVLHVRMSVVRGENELDARLARLWPH